MTFHLSRAGRQSLLIFIAATLLLLIFAAWLLFDTLGLRLATFAASWASAEWSAQQQLVACALLGVLAGALLLGWRLTQELFARYTVDDTGLTMRSLALRQTFPWETIRALRTIERADERVRVDVLAAIDGALRRMPISTQVADYETLLAAIREHTANNSAIQPPADQSGTTTERSEAVS